MKTSKDPRHQSRVLALQKLFVHFFEQIEGPNTTSIIQEVPELLEINEIKKYDKPLYKALIEGIPSHLAEIDLLITKFAPQWKLDQMPKTDLQIIRMGVYEAFIGKTTPPRVAIDESIELAKDFGGDKSSTFVNGVLGAIMNDYRERGEIKEENKKPAKKTSSKSKIKKKS